MFLHRINSEICSRTKKSTEIYAANQICRQSPYRIFLTKILIFGQSYFGDNERVNFKDLMTLAGRKTKRFFSTYESNSGEE